MYKIFASNKPLILTDSQQILQESFVNLSVRYQSPIDLVNAFDHLETIAELKNIVIYYPDLEELWEQIAISFNVIEAAGGKIYNAKKDILFIERFDKWDLPKGKKELDEMPSETAIREVREECGLSNVSIISPLKTTYHTYKLRNERIIKKTSWFLMNYEGVEELVPQKEEGITQAKWFPENQLEVPLKNTYESIQELF